MTEYYKKLIKDYRMEIVDHEGEIEKLSKSFAAVKVGGLSLLMVGVVMPIFKDFKYHKSQIEYIEKQIEAIGKRGSIR